MDTKQKKRTAARMTQSRSAVRRRKSAPRKRTGSAVNQPRRVVKGPREEIPEVVYTMPRPFHRNSFLLKLVTVAAAALAVLACISLFFRVDTVKVAGADRYSEQQILEASGIEYGEGLLGVSKGTTVSRIRLALPYVDEVKITVELPGTVIIEVTELEAAYAIETVDGWWLVSAHGRAIEAITAERALDYPKILGVTARSLKADQTAQAVEPTQTDASILTTAIPTETETQPQSETQITVPVQTADEQQKLDAAWEVLCSIEENGGLGQVLSIDVTAPGAIVVEYRDRFTVSLGSLDDLDRKVRLMVASVTQLRAEGYDGGTLDVSLNRSEDPIFTPER